MFELGIIDCLFENKKIGFIKPDDGSKKLIFCVDIIEDSDLLKSIEVGRKVGFERDMIGIVKRVVLAGKCSPDDLRMDEYDLSIHTSINDYLAGKYSRNCKITPIFFTQMRFVDQFNIDNDEYLFSKEKVLASICVYDKKTGRPALIRQLQSDRENLKLVIHTSPNILDYTTFDEINIGDEVDYLHDDHNKVLRLYNREKGIYNDYHVAIWNDFSNYSQENVFEKWRDYLEGINQFIYRTSGISN